MTKTSWKYQKLRLKKKIPTRNEILVIASKIENPRNKALFTLLYLTGCRVSELVGDKKHGYMPLKRKDIEFTRMQNRDVVLIHMENRKNKKKKFKDIPIPTDKEKDFFPYFMPYLKQIPLENPIFAMTPRRAGQILAEFDYNPHFLRHIRLTHLVLNHDFNDFLLRRWAGWSSPTTAQHYIELRWVDFLDKM